jgi:phage terminase large subunit-like protein
MPKKPDPTMANLFTLLRDVAQLPGRERQILVNAMPAPVRRAMEEHWKRWAHKGQYPDDGDWRVWLISAGRGFGKTRAGAEWVSALARARGDLRIALVGATQDEVRRVMVEGESGILSVARSGERLDWQPSKGELIFPTGSIALTYGAAAPESLRGPQHHFAWCDELGKWPNGKLCWDNLLLGMRLQQSARVLVTTTPQPSALLGSIKAMPGCHVVTGPTHDNGNLPDDYIAYMESLYGGTRLGRQELLGEYLEDHEDALWTRDLLERCRVKGDSHLLHAMKRIVIGVDPPASAGGDACGIVVVGKGADGMAYVLADHSVRGRSPEGWARAVAAAASVWGADRVVAEANNGGDMVISTLRAADVGMPVKKVHASHAKVARAEPVSALYTGGKAFHAGAFPALEDELCGLISGGAYEGPGRSPDRADALVWAMSELMLGKVGVEARVRGL